MTDPLAGVPFAEIVAASPVATIVLDPERDADGRIVDFAWRYRNGAAADALHALPGGDEGTGMLTVVPDQREAGLFDAFVRAHEDDEPFRDEVRFESMELAGVFSVYASRLGDHLLVLFVDVTARVEAETRERESRGRVLRTLARVSDAVFSVDEDWCFSYLNPRAADLLGRDAEELIGRSVWDEFPFAVGTLFERQYRHAVAYGEPVEFEAHYPLPLDTWFEVRAYPGRRGLTVFFRDVGPRHRLEEHATDLKRLEGIATLASGIAHDFNNLLMAIDGHARLLEGEVPDPVLQGDVAAIREAAARATALTRQLSAFSRTQVLRPTMVDLDGAVQRARADIEALLPDRAHLELRLADAPVLVDADPVELDRALLELADNAGRAMSAGDRLLIETSLVEVTEDDALAHPEQAPGWYGVLTMSDSGAGMAPAVLTRAVEPFFSTRRGAGSTGLGLSSVHGMVNQSGGRLSIYSEEGTGTTVRLHLVRAASDAPLHAPPDTKAAIAPLMGEEVVLVLDDNQSIRDLMQRILVEHGYTVLSAELAEDAIGLLDRHPDIALLVTDVVLGADGTTGDHVAAEARRRRPDLGVLFVSGYPEGLDVTARTSGRGTGFLTKPFGPHDLLRQVRRLIDTPMPAGGP